MNKHVVLRKRHFQNVITNRLRNSEKITLSLSSNKDYLLQMNIGDDVYYMVENPYDNYLKILLPEKNNE